MITLIIMKNKNQEDRYNIPRVNHYNNNNNFNNYNNKKKDKNNSSNC